MANPIQGLLDFIQAHKPYHTKVLEALVNYAHNDDVDVSFSESALFEIGMVIATELADNSGTLESIVETCPRGFGDTYDQAGQYLVIYGTAGNVYIAGDQTDTFVNGSSFIVRDPTETASDLTYTVNADATYDSVTDRTVISVNETVTGDFIDITAPPNNDTTIGDAFAVYNVVSTTATGNIIVFSGPGISIDDFIPGFAIEVFGATDSALNRKYRIIAAFETGTDEITCFVVTNVLTDSTGDGQAAFAGYGYDEPTFCVSPDVTVVKPFFVETLDIVTEEGGNPSYQHFILDASDIDDSFVVEGDVRTSLGGGFDVIHAIDSWSTIVTFPTINGGELNYGFGATLSGNVGTYTVDTISYDPNTNRSTIFVNETVAVGEPTGFIVPT